MTYITCNEHHCICSEVHSLHGSDDIMMTLCSDLHHFSSDELCYVLTVSVETAPCWEV